MTSAQNMRSGTIVRSAGCVLAGALFLAQILLIPACVAPRELVPPLMLEAPYETPRLWAVAPFGNETGSAGIETDHLTDLFIEQAQQVYGIDAVPLNRVIGAMRTMELPGIRTPADAHLLMNGLGVDGLIVGTITAYDPYQPPKLGVAIQLYLNPDRFRDGRFDPNALYNESTGQANISDPALHLPVAQAAGVFDASNHLTQYWIDDYARGRTTPDSAYGTDIYLVSMDLYTQFVSFRLLNDLLLAERARVHGLASTESSR